MQHCPIIKNTLIIRRQLSSPLKMLRSQLKVPLIHNHMGQAPPGHTKPRLVGHDLLVQLASLFILRRSSSAACNI